MDLGNLLPKGQVQVYDDLNLFKFPQSTQGLIFQSYYPSRLELALKEHPDTSIIQYVSLLKTKESLSAEKLAELITSYPKLSFVFDPSSGYATELYQKLVTLKPSTQQIYLPPTIKNIKTNLILLLRDQKRVDHVHHQIVPKLGSIEHRIFQAIDARTPGKLDDCVSQFKIPITMPIRAGKIGCFFTHYQLWLELAQTEELCSCYLILEDDNLPIKEFESNLEAVLRQIPLSFDLVYFYLPDEVSQTPPLDNQYLVSSVIPTSQTRTPLDSCAYLISRKGASKLVSQLKQIQQPLSPFLWEHPDLESYYLARSLFGNVGEPGPSGPQQLLSNTTASEIYQPK